MKIYHTATQEDYNDLMRKFERDETAFNCWVVFMTFTCVMVKDNSFYSYCGKEYAEKTYPDIPIVEWKKKENNMKTVEYNNVFPKEVYKKMKEYECKPTIFWKDFLDNEFSNDIGMYLINKNNKRNVAIALATGDFECEKEKVGYIRVKGQKRALNKGLITGAFNFNDTIEVSDVQTKFTKEEFEAFKNSLVWEEITDGE